MPTTAEEYESMFAINAAACFFIQKAGIRMHDRGKIITILTSLPAAFTGCTPPCWQQSVGGTLPRGTSVNNVATGPMDTPFFSPAE